MRRVIKLLTLCLLFNGVYQLEAMTKNKKKRTSRRGSLDSLFRAIERKNYKNFMRFANPDSYKFDINTPKEKGTPLTASVNQSFVNAVKLLLTRSDILVNRADTEKKTPLHFATNAEIVTELLKHKDIKPNEQDQNGDTPLHLAIKKRQWEIAKLLLNATYKQADEDAMGYETGETIEKNHIQSINKQNKKTGNTALHNALEVPLQQENRKAHLEVIELLVDRASDDDKTIQNKEGNTPLHLLAKNLKPKNKNEIQAIWNELIPAYRKKGTWGVGAYKMNWKNGADKNGDTPLHVALKNNNHVIIDLLRNEKQYIDLNVKDSDGKTVQQLLTEYDEDQKQKATQKKKQEKIQQQKTQKKLVVDAKKKKGATKKVIAKKIVKQAQPQKALTKDEWEKGIFGAIESNDASKVKELLKHQSARQWVNLVRDEDGDTPLTSAASRNLPTIVQELLKTGLADPTILSKEGNSPLILATEMEDTKEETILNLIKEILKNKKVNPNEQSKQDQNAALHIAVTGNLVSVIKHLLSLPTIKIHLKTKKGNTALDGALSRGYLEVVKLLINHPQMKLQNLQEARDKALKNKVTIPQILTDKIKSLEPTKKKSVITKKVQPVATKATKKKTLVTKQPPKKVVPIKKDEAIVDAVKKGDEQALEKVIEDKSVTLKDLNTARASLYKLGEAVPDKLIRKIREVVREEAAESRRKARERKAIGQRLRRYRRSR